MEETMKQFQQNLIEIENEAEHLLFARHQLVESDIVRNGNREALTALRKRARTTKTSVTSPFESIMKDTGGPGTRPLVKEVCTTCGNHDSNEHTWMMFPGTDVFAKIPFHAAHTILETECSHCCAFLCDLVLMGVELKKPMLKLYNSIDPSYLTTVIAEAQASQTTECCSGVFELIKLWAADKAKRWSPNIEQRPFGFSYFLSVDRSTIENKTYNYM
ncbi:p53 and DNA damage-regulated protein 1 [Citrus sinensis]|uniref:P53 and DNA damage-regulated protein 1 n=1 Tax=Citrus sinensis TaxID=2711 RepID=A0ACB8MSB2_CITSI|nr:p53 and DNA damage-regulated protein 1 [Citrus sinensis]